MLGHTPGWVWSTGERRRIGAGVLLVGRERHGAVVGSSAARCGRRPGRSNDRGGSRRDMGDQHRRYRRTQVVGHSARQNRRGTCRVDAGTAGELA